MRDVDLDRKGGAKKVKLTQSANFLMFFLTKLTGWTIGEPETQKCFNLHGNVINL